MKHSLWRIILVCTMLLFNVVLCSAASSNVNDVLQEYKDLSNRFDAGMNYYEFKESYQNIYVDSQRIKEKFPESANDINSTLGIYEDIKALWYIGEPFAINSKNYVYLYNKYPKMFTKIVAYKSGAGNDAWSHVDAITWLIHEGYDRSKELQIKNPVN